MRFVAKASTHARVRVQHVQTLLSYLIRFELGTWADEHADLSTFQPVWTDFFFASGDAREHASYASELDPRGSAAAGGLRCGAVNVRPRKGVCHTLLRLVRMWVVQYVRRVP